MSTTPHSSSKPSHSFQRSPYSTLPPVAITRQALFQFNLSIYQQLVDLENKFACQPKPLAVFSRNGWQPPLRKPR